MDEEIASAECPELLRLLGKEEADYIRLYAVQSTVALAKQGTAFTRSKTKIFFDSMFSRYLS
jgi:hypothetical protein